MYFKEFWERFQAKNSIKVQLFNLLRKFRYREDFYIVGGCLRDLYLNRNFNDIDFALKGADIFAQFVADFLKLKYIPLSKEFGIFRVAGEGFYLDFTELKGSSIEEDLKKRDFTINALALHIKNLFEKESFYLIDPFNGLQDLFSKKIRAISEENIEEDPLRILRGYRFFAEGFGKIESSTRQIFRKFGKALLLCAPERINYELIRILVSKKAYQTVVLMDEDGILDVLFSEIKKCKGVPQPSYHHLDVWGHMLMSLKYAEEIINNPEEYLYPIVTELPEEEEFVISVKLGSLFHDLGKGYTFAERIENGEKKITFYGHEKVSAELFKKIGKRLRFSNSIIERVCLLVKSHMRPVHLLNEKLKGTLSIRAKRKLIKDVPYLTELFVVSMADSLASKGPDKDPDYEEKLKSLFNDLFILKKELEEEKKKPRLITGHDLIKLGFKPGPIFKYILEDVEVEVLSGNIKTKEEALEFVLKKYGEKRDKV